ncbi:SDR family NAD(P)-dependent oxidoreductase [Bauldia litoralis]|uniref:SDR family NAD(P)-dependent oxidoreductase n=1 Tax=Bauldia litoralis TaxID=665467 RepID=UPI003267F821
MTTSNLRIPDLADKVFLVTGGSTGIGAAVALALAEQGAAVAVHYNSSETQAREVSDAITKNGGNAFLVKGDVSQHAANAEIVDKTADHFGKIDGLINNAGAMLGRIPLEESDEAHDRAVVDLNSHSVVWMTRAALPWLRKSRGVVINTTSIAASNGGGGGAILYAASKGFVSTITKGLAKEFVGEGIRVNAVSPGVILTPFHERFSTDEQMKGMVATIPMGRAGTPEECVGAYLFLASDALSGYVTGQVIEVNGGQLMPG